MKFQKLNLNISIRLFFIKSIKCFSFLLISLSLFCFCETQKSEKPKINNLDKAKINTQLIKVNQQLIAKQNDEMDYYQKSHQFPFIKTESGVRYYIYKPSKILDSIVNGDVITINYNLLLLDGTICYSSNNDGAKEFKVGMQDVEVGLHKAVLYLKQGDKALILIPSHLAHGLLGDSKKIPPLSPILYDVEIVTVKKKM